MSGFLVYSWDGFFSLRGWGMIVDFDMKPKKYIKVFSDCKVEVPDDMLPFLPELRVIIGSERKIKRSEKKIGKRLQKVLDGMERRGDYVKLLAQGHFLSCVGSSMARFFYEAAYRLVGDTEA